MKSFKIVLMMGVIFCLNVHESFASLHSSSNIRIAGPNARSYRNSEVTTQRDFVITLDDFNQALVKCNNFLIAQKNTEDLLQSQKARFLHAQIGIATQNISGDALIPADDDKFKYAIKILINVLVAADHTFARVNPVQRLKYVAQALEQD